MGVKFKKELEQLIASENIADLMDSAMNFFEKKAFKEASFLFEKIVEIMPNNHNQIYLLAECYYQQGKIDEAINYYKQIIELESNNDTYYLGLGSCYKKKDLLQDALKNYNKAYELNPKKENNLLQLGFLHIKLLEMAKAEEFFMKVIDSNPKSSSGYFGTAIIQSFKQLPSEALLSSLKAINYDTQNNLLFNSLIKNILSQFKGINHTISELESSLEQTGDYSSVGNVLVSLLDVKGDEFHYLDTSRKVINLLRKDPNFSLKKEGIFGSFEKSSSNPVKVDLTNIISENLYIIKTNDSRRDLVEERKRLEEEYVTHSFISNTLALFDKKSFDKVPIPLSYFEQDDEIFYFQKRKKGLTLEELAPALSPKALTKEIKLVLETMAKVHFLATEELELKGEEYFFGIADQEKVYEVNVPKISYFNNFIERAIKGKVTDKNHRLGFNDSTGPFIEAYNEFMNFSYTPHFLHGDFYECNVLEGGSIIDWEKKCVGDLTFDLSHFLENPFFDHLDKSELISHYVNSLMDFGVNKDLIYEMNDNYHKNKVHNLFCQIGANLNQGKNDIALMYTEKTLETIQGKLKDTFVNFLNATTHNHLKQLI